MRTRTMFVGVDAHIDPHGTQPFSRYVAAKRSCPTGGQGRPPLQDILRLRRKCVQFCNCTLPGRARHRPLRTYYVVAGNARKCACASCTGGVEPLPYAMEVNLPLQPIIDTRRNIAERIIYGASAVEQRGVDLLERMDDRRVIAPELAPDLRQRQIRHLAN